MNEQEAAYVTTNWAAKTCGHPVCRATAVYYHGLSADNQAELCPVCAGEYLTRLYRAEAKVTLEASAFWGGLDQMRAAILALAERMERPMPGLGNDALARELRKIAG